MQFLSLQTSLKIFAFILFSNVVFVSQVFAQSSSQGEFPRARVLTQQEEQQALQDAQGAGSVQNSGLSLTGGVGASFASCIGASGVTNVVRGAVSNLTAGFASPTRVPVNNPALEGKETGSVLSANISWDQMGWCLANSLIEEIGRATVNWINTGFQGNPVFVDDPAQFFSDIADVQAGIFLDEVTGGLLCTPIKDWVRINLAQNYNSQFTGYGDQQCTFSDNALTRFMDGETFSWDDWFNYTQNPYNNPYGAVLYGQIALNQRIGAALNLQQTQLNWSAGFLSKRDPQTGKITSPGSVIEAQVNETLFSGKRRLEIADEFDEVVNALVNNLIRVAISEMTEATQ